MKSSRVTAPVSLAESEGAASTLGVPAITSSPALSYLVAQLSLIARKAQPVDMRAHACIIVRAHASY
jgi:hypothetical protein